MSLKEYQRKRDFKKTSEPRTGPRSRKGPAHFVVQKHDASRLHYDFRLEMDGVLKSWALPKGLPFKHGEKHLAVHVEDHPLAYGEFEGTIPKGQYGGGTVMLWDRGTYDPQTSSPLKDLDKGKLHFELHGEKLKGEWYLVRLRGEDDQWLIIRGGDDTRPPSARADDRSVASGRTMKQLSHSDSVWQSKPRKQATPTSKSRTSARLPAFVPAMNARLVDAPPPGDWIYEIKFDGWRALVLKDGEKTRLVSRNEKDFTDKFPDLTADLASLNISDAILDGEIVALDENGRSSFQTLQAALMGDELPPLHYYAFDLLRLDGHDLRAEPLEKRKDLLHEVLQGAPDSIRFSDSLGRNYTHLSKQARKLGLEGLIGKRPDSTYESGRRTGTWIKLKFAHEQELVIAGYTPPQGSREHFGALLIGALLIGYYEKGKLHAAGKVGTGFTQKMLSSLAERFRPLQRKTSPFDVMDNLTSAEIRSAHWLKPTLVAQIHFKEWTREGRLRQPVFLGLREDKAARDVVREVT